MNKQQKQLLTLLESTFNPQDDVHFLAIAETQIQVHDKERPVHQVRVALTFKEGNAVNPYYDGTDLFVTMDENGIHFTLEKDWADGPPAVEGSPIGLALSWVSSLAPPFYISPEAIAATQSSSKTSESTDRSDK